MLVEQHGANEEPQESNQDKDPSPTRCFTPSLDEKFKPAAKIEAAYRRADAAIEELIDLLAPEDNLRDEPQVGPAESKLEP